MNRLARELAEVAAAVAAIDADGIGRFVDLLEETQRASRTVFLAGNGGSGANASHFTQDLRNAVPHGRLDVRNLSDNVPVITAIANDRGFDRIFDLQLKGNARSGDLLVAFSCSGKSDNVLNGVAAARELGVRVVGFTGFDGGALRQRCDLSLHVPLMDFGQSEAVHAVILHLAAASLARRLAGASEPGGDALDAATQEGGR
jgi:D-sedoheptulose 7-phosphate isomerase